jgi:hypothetical protein
MPVAAALRKMDIDGNQVDQVLDNQPPQEALV